MPRNGSGTYTLPEAAFVSGTVISSTAVNSDFSDIGTALTDSLARDGQGGMTDTLPLAPTGFNYTNDPDTGMRRTGTNAQAIECGGTDIAEFSTTGETVNGNLDVLGNIDFTGSLTKNGSPFLPVGLGPLPWSGRTAPALWLLCYGQSLLRASYPDLWTFAQAEIAGGNTLYTNGNGTTTFTIPDMRGRVAAGKDNMGGVAANRLTSTSVSPDANTLGGSGGAQVNSLTQDNLPNVNFAVTASGTSSLTVGGVNGSSGGNSTITLLRASTDTPSGTNPVSGTVNVTGTAASGGTAAGFIIVQPSLITNYIIYAGV